MTTNMLLGPEVTTGGPVLQGVGLCLAYATAKALDGVDLDLAAGESLAIMGPSGSGTTTLLHVLAGILVPDSGVVRLRGREVQALSADRAAPCDGRTTASCSSPGSCCRS